MMPKNEEAKKQAKIFCGDAEYRKSIVGNVLRCCPCAFRWRRAVGVDDKDIEGASTVNEVHRLTDTPVITLRPKENADTMYA